MLKSMTGFGAGDADNEDYRFHIEVKSVNQRYLDVDVHMPRVLNAFEDRIRNTIKQYASRGKMDVNVSFLDKRTKPKQITVDKNLALAYSNALNEISEAIGESGRARSVDIARFPDVLIVEDIAASLDGAEVLLDQALTEALTNFVEMRKKEGKNIEADFLKRIGILEDYVEEISSLAPQIVAYYRERLEKTVSDVLSAQEIDENRLIQETAIYADRVNYTEEIVRLRSHFKQFRDIINEADAPVGRKLDFLIQEMNREINTTASKANNVKAAQLSVDVKSEIEKLREQVQNIE